MTDADERVARLILRILHTQDRGWRGKHPAPSQHFADCPDVTVTRQEIHTELWIDTGVDATRFTAEIACPHEGSAEYEWAHLGSLPAYLEELDQW
jgi:hypothetical protein